MFASNNGGVIFLLFQCWTTTITLVNAASSFNFEIERRVIDAIDAFFGVPEDMVLILKEYRANHGFTYNLSAPDRDVFGAVAHSLRNVSHVDMIYYGAEDGLFMGWNIEAWATYREPGNSGYVVAKDDDDNNETRTMQHYYTACVDETTGEPRNCTLAGEEYSYIDCVDECSLKLCEGSTDIWCRQYALVNATTTTSNNIFQQQRGFVPRTYHCHDIQGQFTQQPGVALKADGSLGDCLFGDGTTLVNRNLTGDYAYCKDDDNDCARSFVGGYRSTNYDPRLRDWYQDARKFQRPVWSDPYLFFTTGTLGITYGHPIYSSEQGKNGGLVMEGVLGVDYTFQELSFFLNQSYGSSSELVAIYERAEPNYLVATSTAFETAAKVLADDMTTSCSYDPTVKCTVVRRSMNQIGGDNNVMNDLIHAAYLSQVDNNYPRGLVSVKVSDIPGSQAYASKSSFYSAAGDKNLEWVILVISPVERSSTDAITTDDGLFGVVCAIAGLGFILCILMLVSFLSQRKQRAVILTDWRFTSAFLTGCALLNLASLTFLGDNTQGLCILRMWSFHFLFACALSPLFVKVGRVYRLVASTDPNPSIISSTVAVLLTLPIILLQVLILTIFTLVDPAEPEESILIIDEEGVTQFVTCEHGTSAFAVVILVWEFGLVLVGCWLAFRARKVDPGFGQSTELLFSMFNIAFIGIGILIVTVAMNVDQQAQIVLNAMGVFWGTVYSSAAFVVPRLLQARQDTMAQSVKASHTARASIRNGDNHPQPNNNPNRSVMFQSEDTNAGTGIANQQHRQQEQSHYQHPSSRVLSGEEIPGWSAVDMEDDVAEGMRSTTSQVE